MSSSPPAVTRVLRGPRHIVVPLASRPSFGAAAVSIVLVVTASCDRQTMGTASPGPNSGPEIQLLAPGDNTAGAVIEVIDLPTGDLALAARSRDGSGSLDETAQGVCASGGQWGGGTRREGDPRLTGGAGVVRGRRRGHPLHTDVPLRPGPPVLRGVRPVSLAQRRPRDHRSVAWSSDQGDRRLAQAAGRAHDHRGAGVSDRRYVARESAQALHPLLGPDERGGRSTLCSAAG